MAGWLAAAAPPACLCPGLKTSRPACCIEPVWRPEFGSCGLDSLVWQEMSPVAQAIAPVLSEGLLGLAQA